MRAVERVGELQRLWINVELYNCIFFTIATILENLYII